jgi:hypothetical protein
MNYVLDVNVYIKALEASGRPGQLPTAGEAGRTVAGRFLTAALQEGTLYGEKVTIAISKHIFEVFSTKAAELGLCSKAAANQWLLGILQRFPKGALVVDTTNEDYAALRTRARHTDGVLDANGRPDVEDEAILRLCQATGSTLVTYESEDNLPTFARRRGIPCLAARKVERLPALL